MPEMSVDSGLEFATGTVPRKKTSGVDVQSAQEMFEGVLVVQQTGIQGVMADIRNAHQLQERWSMAGRGVPLGSA